MPTGRQAFLFPFRKPTRMKTGVVIALGLFTAFLASGVYFLAESTYVGAWRVLFPSMAVAACVLPFSGKIRRRLFGAGTPRWIGLVSVFVADSVFAMALFYIVNFCFAGKETAEPAVVVRVYSEERHHKRRVGRGRYVNGDAYRVYQADVALREGWRKTIALTPRGFAGLHQGDTVFLNVARGLFGFDVTKGIAAETP